MTEQEMINVIQHYMNGGTIEFKQTALKEDWSFTTTPSWDFSKYSYRIKTEPREFWIAYGVSFTDRESAEYHMETIHNSITLYDEIIHVREVIDD